jgi:hypothetical protein
LASILQLPVLVAIARALAGRWQRVLLLCVTSLASLAQARRSFRSADNDVTGLARTALGFEPQHDFLAKHVGLFSLYEKVNAELPQDSGVLLSCYCGGFYLDRTTYCADIVQGSLRMTTWDEFLADVRHLRVTHVLAPRTLAEGGPLPPYDASGVGFMVREQEYALVGRLLAQHGTLLASAADQGLYALDLASTTAR